MTRKSIALLLCAAAALASCGVIPAQTPDRAACVGLFQEYDRLLRFRPEYVDEIRGGIRLSDGRLAQIGVLLVQNDCLTRPGDLAGMDAVAAARAGRGVVEGGESLGRPVAVHAGAVTGGADEAIAFFEGLGVRATSIGSPRLGRRVYVGPVTTVDGLNALTGLAREAGFVAPYASEYFRF